MQKLVDAVYSVFSKVLGGIEKLTLLGDSKGTVRNGRKYTISMLVILLLFICAIFVPNSKVFLTDAVFMGGLASMVAIYIGGNAASKLVELKKKKTDEND